MPEFNNIEHLQIFGLADYHCHCDYSVDAVGTIEDYCRAALKKGLVEICFTTHYDSSPNSEWEVGIIRVNGKELPAIPENLAPYVDHVRAAHEEFFPRGLAVKLGLEFGWYPGCEEKVTELSDRYGFEYMMCGIHELENACFSCHDCFEKCFSRYSVEELVEKYMAEVIAAAGSGLFHSIAHLDYIRKYGEKYYGPKLMECILVHAPSVFKALRESQTALEVNTSAMRRGLNDYYPSVKLVNAARRADVEIRYLGSDAHKPEEVGFDFDAAAALVTIENAWSED